MPPRKNCQLGHHSLSNDAITIDDVHLISFIKMCIKDFSIDQKVCRLCAAAVRKSYNLKLASAKRKRAEKMRLNSVSSAVPSSQDTIDHMVNKQPSSIHIRQQLSQEVSSSQSSSSLINVESVSSEGCVHSPQSSAAQSSTQAQSIPARAPVQAQKTLTKSPVQTRITPTKSPVQTRKTPTRAPVEAQITTTRAPVQAQVTTTRAPVQAQSVITRSPVQAKIRPPQIAAETSGQIQPQASGQVQPQASAELQPQAHSSNALNISTSSTDSDNDAISYNVRIGARLPNVQPVPKRSVMRVADPRVLDGYIQGITGG